MCVRIIALLLQNHITSIDLHAGKTGKYVSGTHVKLTCVQIMCVTKTHGCVSAAKKDVWHVSVIYKNY